MSACTGCHAGSGLHASTLEAYVAAEASLRATVKHAELPQSSWDKLAPKWRMVTERVSDLKHQIEDAEPVPATAASAALSLSPADVDEDALLAS